MPRTVKVLVVWFFLILPGLNCLPASGAERDPLSSWNDGSQ
jgi:hypothetical protein